MVAVTLALASALFGGLADFFGGIQSRRFPVLTVLVVSQTFALAGAGIIVLASDRAAPDGPWPVFAALAGLGIAVALASLYRALAIGMMTIVAPVAATGAVIPVVFGLAMGEQLGAFPLAGIVLALAGLVLVSRGESGHLVTGRQREGIALALLSACGFGGFFVSMNEAADTDPLWALLVSRLSFVLLAGAAALVLARPVIVRVDELPRLVGIGLLDLGAATTFSLATTEGLLGIVSVLASLPPLITVIMARIVLKERVRRSQRVGVVLTLLGVPLIALG